MRGRTNTVQIISPQPLKVKTQIWCYHPTTDLYQQEASCILVLICEVCMLMEAWKNHGFWVYSWLGSLSSWEHVYLVCLVPMCWRFFSGGGIFWQLISHALLCKEWFYDNEWASWRKRPSKRTHNPMYHERQDC